MRTKKIISFVLALIMVFGLLSSYVVAYAGDGQNHNASLNETIRQLKELDPDAEFIVEDGEIHIYTQDDSAFFPNVEDDMTSPVMLSSNVETNTCNAIEAPEGGTYKGFVPPWYTKPGDLSPYAKVYLPCTAASAMQKILENKNAFNYIKDNAVSQAVLEGVWNAFRAKFTSIPLGYAEFVLIAMEFGIQTYNEINKNSFNKAYNSSNSKSVSITYMTANGWPTNLYSAWDSDMVSCSPYEEWKPYFYRGEYGM